MVERRATADRRRPKATEQRRLRAIIEQLADGIIIVGADGVIRFANPAAAHLFARPVHELVGSPFGFPVVNSHPAEIDIVRRGAEPVTGELRVVDVDWDGESARLVSIRDVTDRRRAEERARQVERERAARERAEAANQAKSDFLATMSHELRTPLNAVIGYSQLLDLGIGGTLSPEQQRHVDRILTSSHHLLGLVNELLDLAKIDAGRLAVHLDVVPVRGTVDAAAALVQPTAASRGVTFAVRADDPDESPGTLFYEGDEDRVRQILVNLLANAVKFTDTGGTVTLTYGRSTTPDPEARLRGGGAWVYFRVRDTGIGIPADQCTHIFDPFFQVDSGRTRANDGSGLGLAISRRLARAMGGDITVHSVIGDGSSFVLWLPWVEPSEQDRGKDAQRRSAVAPRPHGLGDVGEIVMREMQPLLDAFAARLRVECAACGAASLRFSQLVDHVASYVADLAGVLIALEEADGEASAVLVDAAHIHRLVASRHGTQRARLGWTEDAIRQEYRILQAEIEDLVRRRARTPDDPAVEAALAVIARLNRQAEQVSLRAYGRAIASRA